MKSFSGTSPGRPDLQEALRFAQTHLSSSKRLSTQSFAAHGSEVASVLQEIVSSPSLLRVAILHDILKLPRGEILLAHAPLSGEEALLIRLWHEHFVERASHRRLSDWPSSYSPSVDPRLHLLLAAHVLADIRHLDRFTREERKRMCVRILREADPALRSLRLHTWVTELEDRSFLEVQPEVAGTLQAQYAITKVDEHRYLLSMVASVRRLLEEQGIPHDLTYRQKSLYSIYRKMHRTGKSFEEIRDRIGIRIVTADTETCYRVHQSLQERFPGLWGEQRDFVQMPKMTGYRSLHAVLLGSSSGEFPLEIQICAEDQHFQNEYGAARHALYKCIRYFGTAWNPLYSETARRGV